MNTFLKDLLILTEELNNKNGFEAVVAINEMQMLYDNHIKDFKQEPLSHVYLVQSKCNMRVYGVFKEEHQAVNYVNSRSDSFNISKVSVF